MSQPSLTSTLSEAASPVRRSPLSLVETPASGSEPVTISAREMSRLTGVERERLRTWERRHGFPVPVRCGNNVRRYRAEDVRRICAVSRLAASGTPLADAIALTLADAGQDGISSLGIALDGLDAPAIAVSGPRPMTVQWCNGATQAGIDGPEIGDDLTAGERLLGVAAGERVRQLMVGEIEGPQIVEHDDWMSSAPVARRSLAWRVDAAEASAPPVVVLVQLPELSAPSVLDRSASTVGAWLAGAAAARRALQGGSGLQGVQRSLQELVGAVGAVDGVIGLCGSDGATLRIARSLRGTVAPHAASIDGPAGLRQRLAAAEVAWLQSAELGALGFDPRRRALMLPLVAGNRPLGAVLLVFRAEVACDEVARELLHGLGTTLAAVIDRERALARERARAAA